MTGDRRAVTVTIHANVMVEACELKTCTSMQATSKIRRLFTSARPPRMSRAWQSIALFGALLLCLVGSGVNAPAQGVMTVGTTPVKRGGGKWAGKTIVITGASSGFGQGAALRFGAEGGNVVLAARRTGLLNEVAAQIRSTGGQALVVTTDVGKSDQVERLAKAAVARFGKIDVWVNDAGVGVIGRFWEIPVTDFSRLIDTNLKGIVYGSHAAVRQFVAQGYGTLVNVGSIDSAVPVAYQNVYSATKAGVLALDMALIQELRLSGYGDKIKVSTIMPWAVDTPWWPHAANYSGHTARMAAMDDPKKVVDAIVHNAAHPSAEAPVGWKAQGAYISHRISPDLTERITANIAHQQMKKGASLPKTTGSLYHPMRKGRDVEGGVRKQMKAEDKRQSSPVDGQ